jgi:CheY-like chemotaxis protein
MERITIAVVDDDPDDLAFISNAITSVNPEHQVVAFASGSAFFDHCATTAELPVLVVLDYNMPIMNGETILIRMHQQDALYGIKVVFLSTGMTINLRERLTQLGAYACLNKPASTEGYKRLANSLIQLAEELANGKDPSFVFHS